MQVRLIKLPKNAYEVQKFRLNILATNYYYFEFDLKDYMHFANVFGFIEYIDNFPESGEDRPIMNKDALMKYARERRHLWIDYKVVLKQKFKAFKEVEKQLNQTIKSFK